jgi:hypothetical protein
MEIKSVLLWMLGLVDLGLHFSFILKNSATLPLKSEDKRQTLVRGVQTFIEECETPKEEGATKIVSWVSPTWHTGIAEYKWIKCIICVVCSLSAPHVA